MDTETFLTIPYVMIDDFDQREMWPEPPLAKILPLLQIWRNTITLPIAKSIMWLPDSPPA